MPHWIGRTALLAIAALALSATVTQAQIAAAEATAHHDGPDYWVGLSYGYVRRNDDPRRRRRARIGGSDTRRRFARRSRRRCARGHAVGVARGSRALPLTFTTPIPRFERFVRLSVPRDGRHHAVHGVHARRRGANGFHGI